MTARSRRFGYLIWPKRLDAEMAALLDQRDTCEIVFDGTSLGAKRVDWKHRRISVGPSQTREMEDSVVTYRLCRGRGPDVIGVTLSTEDAGADRS